jgi:hypothetical protein
MWINPKRVGSKPPAKPTTSEFAMFTENERGAYRDIGVSNKPE